MTIDQALGAVPRSDSRVFTPPFVRPESRRRPRTLVRAIALGAAVCIAPGALAQEQLPCATVGKPSLTSNEEDRVIRVAGTLANQIATGTPSEVQRARNAALRPFFACADQSFAFRATYGRRLADGLRSVIGGDDVHRAVNALQALGPVGIEDTVDLLEDALQDDRAGVRLGAATALGGTVQGNAGSTQLDRSARRAAAASAERFVQEDDAAVSSALTSTLAVTPRSNGPLSRTVAEQLANAVPERLATLDAEPDDLHTWALTMSKATATMRDAVLNLNGGNTSDAQLIRAVSRSSATCLGWALEQLDAADDFGALADGPAGTALRDLVRICEVQLQRADQQLPGTDTGVGGFADALESSFTTGNAGPLADAIENARRDLNEMGVGGAAFDLDR